MGKPILARTCTLEGCDKPFYGRGWCQKHYMRWWTHGNPLYAKSIFGQDREKHPLINHYRSMMQRCYSVNSKAYNRYGGRGIKVCDRWADKLSGLQNFANDMGEKPDKTFSLDRLDNEKGYCPENCRWATSTAQNINRRRHSTNTSGYPGVGKMGVKWYATINIDKKRVWLGLHDTIDKAIEIRKDAELVHYVPLLKNKD